MLFRSDIIKGYTVVYRYNGHDVTTTLPHDPGPTVRVGVSLLPDHAPAVGHGSGTRAPDARLVSRPLPPARSVPVSRNDGYTYRY